MADYCSNFIVFRSSEKDSLQQFLDTLNSLFAESKTKYTDLLLKYDINYSEPLDDNTLYSDDCFFYCKGYFDYCDNDISYNENCKEYYFYAYSYTAWKPQTEVLDLLLKKIPGEIMYYIASEEPGDNLFINTDGNKLALLANYIFVMLFDNLINMLFASRMIVVDSFWRTYFVTILIQAIISIILIFFDHRKITTKKSKQKR